MPVETLSRPIAAPSTTYASLDFLTGPDPTEAIAAGWQKVIDSHLRNWWHGIPGLEDEGLVSPTPNVIRAAINIARSLLEQALDPPSRVLPNGEGGIIFERYDRRGQDQIYETIEIFENLEIELSLYRNSRLISRERPSPVQ